MAIECTDFQKAEKGCLKGYATLLLPTIGMEIKYCSFFEKGNQKWVSFPSKMIKDDEGEKTFVPYISFKSKEIRDGFNKQAVHAIENRTQIRADNMAMEASQGEVFNV